MKQLIIGVVLIVLIGIGAFVYRNAMESPVTQAPPEGKACTLEAKVCPDGTSVGRTGPNCEFAACAAPNAEDKEIGISFVVPTGFKANADAIGADLSLRAVFDSIALPVGGIPNSVIIRRYAIPAGKTANDVIIANTMHETSGMPAESMSEFKPVIINGKTYQSITVERFEAIIHTEYYRARGNDVLRFEALDRDVTNWTDADLKIETLPAHKAVLDLLSTLQSN
jgi:hypothetical protein